MTGRSPMGKSYDLNLNKGTSNIWQTFVTAHGLLARPRRRTVGARQDTTRPHQAQDQR